MGAIYKSLIISSKKHNTLAIYDPGYLVVSKNGIIEELVKSDPRKKYQNYKYFNYADFLICPGFVDTHNHLPQYAFAGIGEKELLPWLKHYTFPREKMFNQKEEAQKSVRVFFSDLIKNGITTTLTYVTIHKSATDFAFEYAKKSKIRAIIGKVIMDQNSPKYLTEKTNHALRDSLALIEKWHGFDNRLFYALTPRFAITCSFKLMTQIGKIAQKKGVYIQSHLAENQDEINFTKKIFPKFKNYTDIYYQAGLLGEKTIMAHCIHLNKNEISLIKKTKTKIAHCPTSNRFLISGIMPFRKYQNLTLDMGLGTDVAGGYSLSIFNEMKEAIENSKCLYMFSNGQSGTPMTVAEAFYLGTLGGAKVLSLENKIGSLEKGKLADFLVIDHLKTDPMGKRSCYLKPEQILSKLIYRGNDSVIKHVYIQGEKIK